jgi:hypothetical protein
MLDNVVFVQSWVAGEDRGLDVPRRKSVRSTSVPTAVLMLCTVVLGRCHAAWALRNGTTAAHLTALWGSVVAAPALGINDRGRAPPSR